MAGADRMTVEEVVRKVLLDEHADGVLRAAVHSQHASGPPDRSTLRQLRELALQPLTKQR